MVPHDKPLRSNRKIYDMTHMICVMWLKGTSECIIMECGIRTETMIILSKQIWPYLNFKKSPKLKTLSFLYLLYNFCRPKMSPKSCLCHQIPVTNRKPTEKFGEISSEGLVFGTLILQKKDTIYMYQKIKILNKKAIELFQRIISLQYSNYYSNLH